MGQHRHKYGSYVCPDLIICFELNILFLTSQVVFNIFQCTKKNTTKGGNMRQINLENDIKPLSEFRANAASFVKQVKETKRPLILTQHGKSSAVLMDVAAYQSLIEQIELLQEVQLAEQQIAEGKILTPSQVKKRIADRYSK